MADCAEIGKRFSHMDDVETTALVPNMKGLEGATAAGIQEAAVFMSASESHNKKNINKSIDETLTQFAELIPEIKQKVLLAKGMVPKSPTQVTEQATEQASEQPSKPEKAAPQIEVKSTSKKPAAAR